LIGFVIALCATAALALPPRAEGAIHLGSPNTVSLANGLVGYWPLDGATINWSAPGGTFSDLSGFGNNASSTGMATTTSPKQGKIGQALNFNGNNSVLRVNDAPSLDITGPFSFSVWVKLSSPLGTYQFLAKDAGTASIWSEADGAVSYATDGGTVSTSAGFLAANQWTLVTVVYEGTRVAFYRNGRVIQRG
jgi:hypothetical protein